MNNVRFFQLKEVANWQLNPEESQVELPELQRGFVWKSNQVESLWDSLLRGFPIGSFLLSKDKDEKLFIMDGQQRATAITLGYYNPWEKSNGQFWSLTLKRVPVLWIDLAPEKKTTTQKYVLRLVTQSHPWGYQCKNNDTVLSIPDRKNALSIFHKNSANNRKKGYTSFSMKNVFPYDAGLPVPLSFLISAIEQSDWQNHLKQLCEKYLPCKHLKTKYLAEDYLQKLSEFVKSGDETIINAVKNLNSISIPCIIANREILESDDEQIGEDPTLFVRLNSSGTKITGEELIYSIYKATFPNSKKLVENIGADFLAPSRVISLVARLAWSELHNDEYPAPMNVNDFRDRIKDEDFRQIFNNLIGTETDSPAANLFQQVIDIIHSKNIEEINTPPVLVKTLLNNSTELLLMVLQWLKCNKGCKLSDNEKRKILSAFTALSWFGKDNACYVREIWNKLNSKNIWNRRTLSIYIAEDKLVMCPLVDPSILRKFLIYQVVQHQVIWEDLYLTNRTELYKHYKNILEDKIEDKVQEFIGDIWKYFIDKLSKNKLLLLFAQREYLNREFDDFNQLETIEDTNTPWDWDHIYPANWVKSKKKINENTRSWSWTTGNLRAISLETNRSEQDIVSPSDRLADKKVREDSFIQDEDSRDGSIKDDWKYWRKITDIVRDISDDDDNDDKTKKIRDHLHAIINRLCNVYAEWYGTLKVGELFGK